MPRKYRYCVFIGRFQPFHLNHKAIIDHALGVADKVIVVLGSADQPRTIKNPFSTDDRVNLISVAYAHDRESYHRLLFTSVRDYTYNDQRWVLDVQNAVDTVIEDNGGKPWDDDICITGNKSDITSWYLEMFPQWDFLEPKGFSTDIKHIHATTIRSALFSGNLSIIQEYLPNATMGIVSNFTNTPAYKTLVAEFEYINAYKASWAPAPYAPTFMTTDAVVVQSGHILLIRRRSAPGAGLFALPGGFLDQNETCESGMLRELREETRIKVPLPVLKGNIKKSKVYDAPGRSLRGRTITNAFLIELPLGPLPRVKGSDDADKAVWVPINELSPKTLFEDHYCIITDLLGI